MAWAEALKSTPGMCVTSRMQEEEGEKVLDPDNKEPEKAARCCGRPPGTRHGKPPSRGAFNSFTSVSGFCNLYF